MSYHNKQATTHNNRMVMCLCVWLEMGRPPTLTFDRLSGTSENWRRTSISCITVVRRDRWKKSEIPKSADTTEKSISTGIKYWVCCIKEPCLISNLFINLFWLKLKWNARSKLFYWYHLSWLWWSSRTLTKIKSQSQKRFNERKYQYWNIRTRISPHRTRKNYRISIWRQI